LGEKIVFLKQRRKGGERWERDSAENKMAHLDPSLKLGSVFFFYISKKMQTRVTNSDLAINTKVRREMSICYIYLFYLLK
jgi:hypothetical protein